MQAPDLQLPSLNFLPPKNYGGVQRIELKNPKTTQIKTIVVGKDALEDWLGTASSWFSSSQRTVAQKGWRQAFKVLLKEWTGKLSVAHLELQKTAKAYSQSLEKLTKNPKDWELAKRTTQLFYQLKLEHAFWVERGPLLQTLSETSSSLKTTKCFSQFQKCVDLVHHTLYNTVGEGGIVTYAATLHEWASSVTTLSDEQRTWLIQHRDFLKFLSTRTHMYRLALEFTLQKLDKALETHFARVEMQGEWLLKSPYVVQLMHDIAQFKADFSITQSEDPDTQAALKTYLEQLEKLLAQLKDFAEIYFSQKKYKSKKISQNIQTVLGVQASLSEYIHAPTQVLLRNRTTAHSPTERSLTPELPNQLRFRGNLREPSGQKCPSKKKVDKNPLLAVLEEHLPADLKHQFPFLIDLLNSFLVELKKMPGQVTIPVACDLFISFLKDHNEQIEELTPEDFFHYRRIREDKKKGKDWIFKNYVPHLEQLRFQIQTQQWKEPESRRITTQAFSPTDLALVVSKMELIFYSAPFTTILLAEVFDPKPSLPLPTAPLLPSALSRRIPAPTPKAPPGNP